MSKIHIFPHKRQKRSSRGRVGREWEIDIIQRSNEWESSKIDENINPQANNTLSPLKNNRHVIMKLQNNKAKKKILKQGEKRQIIFGKLDG